MLKNLAKYALLTNDITTLEKNGAEWNRVVTYLNNTTQYGRNFVVEDIFCLNRHGEKEIFEDGSREIEYRKLLWHGSRVAVFASILSGGLKIMPHSGGRMGKGLYFADIISKSASYCGVASGTTGLVLLNEVALGRIHTIRRDDPSLRGAPPGFESILEEGTQMPDPKMDYLEYVPISLSLFIIYSSYDLSVTLS